MRELYQKRSSGKHSKSGQRDSLTGKIIGPPYFQQEEENGMQPTGADDAAWNLTFLLVGLKLFSFSEMKM